MTKSKFKAPAEHSLLLACLILIWIGPLLKLVGYFTFSWWEAFLALESIWVVTLLVFSAYALVGPEEPLMAVE
jgi:hypothetical protein